MREGADALVCDGEGRLLLVRRADDGCWAMPGGWVDPGETPAQAAVRETLEETGLVVADPWLVLSTRREASLHHTFACRPAGGHLRASPESLEVAFLAAGSVGSWHADHGSRVAAALAAAWSAG
jgi:8-oxo-dGTP pyrophosphatase MutT (NUDIX family)